MINIIRVLDFLAAFIGLVLLSPLMLVILIIGYFETGSPIFVQQRVGKHKRSFCLIKFRTMAIETESVASHLASSSSITKFGAFLRRTKIDELPQLINVLKGDMSLVGPRPNLFNQDELIKLRELYGVYDVLPGITGLAQIRSIDMSTPELLAKTDKEMIIKLNLKMYFKLIIVTGIGRGNGDAVR